MLLQKNAVFSILAQHFYTLKEKVLIHLPRRSETLIAMQCALMYILFGKDLGVHLLEHVW